LHDVKLNLSGLLLGKELGLVYEVMPTAKAGVELSLGIDRSPWTIFDSDPGSLLVFDFDTRVWRTKISYHRYIFRHGPGEGVFIGPFLWMDYLLSLDSDYVSRWRIEQMTEPSELVIRGSGVDYVRGGVVLGYEKLIEDRAPLGITIFSGFDWYEGQNPGSEKFSSLELDLSIYLGYRF